MLTERQSKSIKKTLIDRDIKLIELADILGFSRSYVSNVVNRLSQNKDIEEALLKWKKGE